MSKEKPEFKLHIEREYNEAKGCEYYSFGCTIYDEEINPEHWDLFEDLFLKSRKDIMCAYCPSEGKHDGYDAEYSDCFSVPVSEFKDVKHFERYIKAHFKRTVDKVMAAL